MSSSTEEQGAVDEGTDALRDFFSAIAADIADVFGAEAVVVELTPEAESIFSPQIDQGVLFEDARECNCESCACQDVTEAFPFPPAGLGQYVTAEESLRDLVIGRLRSIIEYGTDDDNAVDSIIILQELGEI
jgi:hypothetical protein